MSGEHRSGGAADAAGSSKATGSGGNRFSKSTHGPPASARGSQPAGRGRGGGGTRGSSTGVGAQNAHPDTVHAAWCMCPMSVHMCSSYGLTLSMTYLETAWVYK